MTGQRGTLPEDEVHVWYVDCKSLRESVAERCASLLSPEETTRRDRFVFDRDRQLYQIAHALTRTTLSRYVDVEPEDWRFESNRYGRPEISVPKSANNLRFNLSHTHGMAVVAVTMQRDGGVDVENKTRRAAGLKVARHFFSPSEVEALSREPPERQQERFFDFWTLKESYIKARGMGLSITLDQFSFHLDDRRSIEIRFQPDLQDDPHSWQFAQQTVQGKYKLAVAVRSDGRTLPIKWLPCDLSTVYD